jgi:hypothetical protein
MKAAHLHYGVRLAAVPYVTLNGRKIALPGGPGDPSGYFCPAQVAAHAVSTTVLRSR